MAEQWSRWEQQAMDRTQRWQSEGGAEGERQQEEKIGESDDRVEEDLRAGWRGLAAATGEVRHNHDLVDSRAGEMGVEEDERLSDDD